MFPQAQAGENELDDLDVALISMAAPPWRIAQLHSVIKQIKWTQVMDFVMTWSLLSGFQSGLVENRIHAAV